MNDTGALCRGKMPSRCRLSELGPAGYIDQSRRGLPDRFPDASLFRLPYKMRIWGMSVYSTTQSKLEQIHAP